MSFAAQPPAVIAPGAAPRYGPPPFGPPGYIEHYSAPTLTYHPLAVQIDGGDTVPTGNTGHLLDAGGDIGLGLSWFPSSALPLGIRVDGSYSWFGIRPFGTGTGFSSGAEAVYGGDADLQVNLPSSSYARFYLIGGGGEYREHDRLRQVSLATPASCPAFDFFCGPYISSVRFGRSTTDWRFAWNAGAGWEIAIGPWSTFFVEARYVQISPSSRKQEFVPIRIGLRF